MQWSSSNPSVANVQNGTITGKGAGEAVITVTIKGTSIKDACTVKINPVKLEGLSFSETEKSILQGESFQLSPVFTPTNATNRNIIWTSSNTRIATVDAEGNVQTIRYGECVIKAIAEDGDFEAECKLTVKSLPLQGISFSDYTYTIEIGGEKQLSVIYSPADVENKNIKWKSSNSIIAPIDEKGVVRGNSLGWATITAESEDGGHVATCDIYVADINHFVTVYFPSSSVVIINGYLTGKIACGINNGSSKSIKLTKFYIYDTDTYTTVAETTDPLLLGSLPSLQTNALSANLNSVYEPRFVWQFECDGRSFTVSKQYGKDYSLLSAPLEDTKSKASTMSVIEKTK